MFDRNIIKLNTRKLAIASLLLALSIIINYFRISIPVGGAPVLRIGFGGPFLKYISLLLGPLYGGIAGGLSDLILFLLKPENGFMWPLTAVEILKGASIAWLWQRLRNINFRIYNNFYIVTFILLIILGIINYMMVNNFPSNIYSELLITIGKKTDYVTVGLIITGFLGLIINFGALLYCKSRNDTMFFEHYLILVIAIGIPCLLGTTVNTFILKSYLYLPDKAFVFLWIPRFIEELVMVLFNTCVLCFLLKMRLGINQFTRLDDYGK